MRAPAEDHGRAVFVAGDGDGGMELTVLGSGGSRRTPMPTCGCDVCRRAREQGPPYSRGGNSLYVHDLAAVVDAPATLGRALNRERIDAVDYCLLTHWHPDHVDGIRTLTARDVTAKPDDVAFADHYRDTAPTLATTERVYERTCELTPLAHLVEEQGFVDLHLLDDEPLVAGDYEVRAVPYALAGDGDRDATAFVLDGPETVVVASDDARYLDVDRLPTEPDLAMFECGLFAETSAGDPLLTQRERELLADELSHGAVLDRVAAVAPDRALLTEIGHQYRRGHDDYAALESTTEYDGVEFAYDGKQLRI